MSCLKGPKIKDPVQLFSLNFFLSIISPFSMEMIMTIHVVSGPGRGVLWEFLGGDVPLGPWNP